MPTPIQILLLEDSALDADLCLAMLGKAEFSFRAERVETKHDFVTALQKKAPDLILADYSLPGFTGADALELARHLRPTTPFVFVSGVLGEELAVEMSRRGATDYVVKQRLDRLVPAVRRALSESQERTKRRDAEKALRESEQRFRMLVELSPVAMWLSQNDRILMVNSAAAELLGGTAEQIVGRDPYEFIDEKCRHMVREQIEKASQGERLRVADAKCVRLDGELVDVALTVARVPYEGGVAVQVNCLDITERKRTEETLFQQAQELKRSNEDLERFAYVASHDMREPLRMVTLYAQLLAMRYGDKLGKDADEFIGFIEAGVQRMNALVEDLLAYSRAIPSAERVSQTVNMNSVLQEVLRGCHAKITETGAEITYDPLPNLPGDAVQIGQVLENLISNSLKYRSNHPPRIRISATREGDYWHFSLSDNGIGFKPSYSQQIFELFKRLHKTEYPGTGIGLAICKRIIEQHDGTIWAESEPGHGSVFHFTLPA